MWLKKIIGIILRDVCKLAMLLKNLAPYMYILASFPVLPTPAFVSQPWRKSLAFSPRLRDKSWGGKDWERGYVHSYCFRVKSSQPQRTSAAASSKVHTHTHTHTHTHSCQPIPSPGCRNSSPASPPSPCVSEPSSAGMPVCSAPPHGHPSTVLSRAGDLPPHNQHPEGEIKKRVENHSIPYL